jgi:hypothetical protein
MRDFHDGPCDVRHGQAEVELEGVPSTWRMCCNEEAQSGESCEGCNAEDSGSHGESEVNTPDVSRHHEQGDGSDEDCYERRCHEVRPNVEGKGRAACGASLLTEKLGDDLCKSAGV